MRFLDELSVGDKVRIRVPSDLIAYVSKEEADIIKKYDGVVLTVSKLYSASKGYMIDHFLCYESGLVWWTMDECAEIFPSAFAIASKSEISLLLKEVV